MVEDNLGVVSSCGYNVDVDFGTSSDQLGLAAVLLLSGLDFSLAPCPYGGRVGEYDPLHSSAGADAETSYVSTPNRLVAVSRGNVLSGDDYQAASQVTAGQWVKFGFDIRSFVQQQDNYLFYAFPVLDVPPGTTTPPDSTTNLIPSHTVLPVTRRLGNAYAQVKVPKLPVHLFVKGDWQARAGVSRLAYLDENTTPAVFAPNPTPPPPLLNTTCGAQCHFQSQLQPLNYTTRNIGGDDCGRRR
jgi:hypothetical protein